MEIIDAHTHEPALTAAIAGTVDEQTAFEISCELSLAAMDAVGVNAAILLARSNWAEFAASRHPTRFYSNIRLDPGAPDIEDLVERAKDTPGVVGLQAYLSWPLTGENLQLLHAGGFERMFSAAEKQQMPISIIVSGDLPELVPVAEAHPDLKLVVPHFGLKQPPLRQVDSPPWLQLPDLLALSRYPNVFVKASGLPTLSATPFPFEDIWPHVHRVLDAFGVDRVIWASDYTRVKPLLNYEVSLAYLRDSSELSNDEKEKVLALNARRVFDLSVADERSRL